MDHLRPPFGVRLFRRDARVIEPALIAGNVGAVWPMYAHKTGNRVEYLAQIALVRLQSLFSLFAIIDVCKKEIPGGYRIFGIPYRQTANLEPSVYAVGAPAPMLNFIDQPRSDGFFTRLDHTRKVIWMNCADEGPVLQLFVCFAEILQG